MRAISTAIKDFVSIRQVALALSCEEKKSRLFSHGEVVGKAFIRNES